MKRIVIAAALAAQLIPIGTSAQSVRFSGRGDPSNDVFLREFIENGNYTLIARDTSIAARDTVRGDVLVLSSTLRLDGVITGDLVIVDANVFLRPSARVLGGVRNVGGGYYPSDLAIVSSGARNEPTAPYEVRITSDGLVITGTARAGGLILDGIKGLRYPTYDRVDGLTLSLGAGYAFPAFGLIEPTLRGHVDYRSHRGEITGGGELAFARHRTELAGGWTRTTLTNEEWNRDAVTNSISSFVQGKDRRDYYEADVAYVEIRRLLESGQRITNAYVRAQEEDARTLVAGKPWSITGDLDRRDNFVINDGKIRSIIGGFDTEWVALTHALELDALVEFAPDGLTDCAVPVGCDEGSFARYAGTVEWAMPAFANHTLEIEVHAQGPLPGTESLPIQRWSFVGGSGTLYTFEDAQFRGDRVLMVETGYMLPLPARFTAPFLGTPTFELLHYAGMAWTAADDRGFEQNVGVRLRYNFLYARAITNPENFKDDVEFSVGVTMPRKLLPWQEAREN